MESDNREVVIYNASGAEVAKTDAKAAKNAAVCSELELTEAGTYYLGGDISNNYFFRVKVVDTVAAVIHQCQKRLGRCCCTSNR